MAKTKQAASSSSPTDELEDELGATGGLDTYPLDTLLIRSEPRAIADVLRRIERKVIVLDPDFERDFVWDEKRQSRLIESVLMRIPLPVFYLAEDKKGKLIVVDGLQRLTTFKRFKDGDLILDIEKNSELHQQGFEDLPEKFQDRFEDGPLTFYLIDPNVPDRVRLDIFERVNSGVPLTRQQMRNALYTGAATKLLRELALSERFAEATGGTFKIERHRRDMKDREAVNRFVAHFTLGWRRYGSTKFPDFDEFLGGALRHVNQDPSEVKPIKAAFLRSLQVNTHVFGKQAFRKPAQGRRNALNLALFEVMSVCIAAYGDTPVTSSRERALREGFEELINEPAFSAAITYATAETRNVQRRFSMTEEMLRGVWGDP
jgi:hypothetical protein